MPAVRWRALQPQATPGCCKARRYNSPGGASVDCDAGCSVAIMAQESAVESDGPRDESVCPVKAIDPCEDPAEASEPDDQPDYFFWGINELYVAP